MRTPAAVRTLAVVAAASLPWHGMLVAQDAGANEPVQRPRVGLVLGGRGARGAAHVAVLRVLDELRIPIDCVVGTSMGALVGATFAAGTPPAEVECEMLAITWE